MIKMLLSELLQCCYCGGCCLGELLLQRLCGKCGEFLTVQFVIEKCCVRLSAVSLTYYSHTHTIRARADKHQICTTRAHTGSSLDPIRKLRDGAAGFMPVCFLLDVCFAPDL